MRIGQTVEHGAPYTPEWDYGTINYTDPHRDSVRVKWNRAACLYWEDVDDLTPYDGRRKTENDSPSDPIDPKGKVETLAQSGQSNYYGGLSLVTRDGEFYLCMGDCSGDDFTGPLTMQQVEAFCTLFEIPTEKVIR